MVLAFKVQVVVEMVMGVQRTCVGMSKERGMVKVVVIYGIKERGAVGGGRDDIMC